MKLFVLFFTCLLSVSFTSSEKPVKVTLYYESYCPDCQDFMAKQMFFAYIKFQGNVTVELLPFGNAQQEYVKGHWEFTCQHGAKECVGNKLHACAINQACNGPDTSNCPTANVTNVLLYITCVEAKPNQKTATVKCAKKYGLDGPAILQCAKSAEGTHDYVPWVLLNGKHNVEAEGELIQAICRLRPKICH